LADIVTPNRTELATLLQIETVGTGTKIDDSDADTAKRARALLEAGPSGPGVRRAVIVTLGASGVVVLERTSAPIPAIGRRPVNSLASSSADATPAEVAHLASAQVASQVASEAAAAGTDGPSPCDDPTDTAGAPERATAGAAPTGRLKPSDLRIWEVPADRVPTIDSTGGGDAFCGALAASLAEGRPLAEAVRRAVAAAALATTHVGAREGMPTANELEEFLAERAAPLA
jgi:sugar/nucleoside kinase (ribokinase family)